MLCEFSECIYCLQGLKDGDHIVQFGSLHAANFADMAQFTNVVQNSIGVWLVGQTSLHIEHYSPQ